MKEDKRPERLTSTFQRKENLKALGAKLAEKIKKTTDAQKQANKIEEMQRNTEARDRETEEREMAVEPIIAGYETVKRAVLSCLFCNKAYALEGERVPLHTPCGRTMCGECFLRHQMQCVVCVGKKAAINMVFRQRMEMVSAIIS